MGAEHRLGHALGTEVAEEVPQEGDAVCHPVFAPAGENGLQPLDGGIAGGKTVGAVGIDVTLEAGLEAVQGVHHIQGILDGHHTVGPGGEKEAGAGVLVHRLDDGGLVLPQFVGGVLPQHGIAQDGSRRAALCQRGRGAGQMAAGGKADDGDLVTQHMPFFRVCVNERHSLLIVLQRPGPHRVRPHGVAQDEGVIARAQVGGRHGVSLPVGAEHVAAAGDHQHGGTVGNAAKLPAHALDHDGQGDVSLFTERDGFVFHFFLLWI